MTFQASDYCSSVVGESRLAALLKKYASSALKGALRVAFERHEPPNILMKFLELLRCHKLCTSLRTTTRSTLFWRRRWYIASTQELSEDARSSAVPVVVLVDTAARPWRSAFIRERALPC